MNKYFIDGLRETEEEGIFPVDDDEAEFWTVYRRDHDGFGMAMFDLCIKEEAEKLVQVLEERDALRAIQNAKQDKPIMYAIIDPYGKPYMSEFCVSPNADDLEGEVEGLNHDLAWEDSEGGRYAVAPLYTAPPVPAVPSFDEWLESTGTHPVGWVREVMEESYNACRAAMLAQQQNQPQNIPNNIPAGWKLVPVDPTKDMLRAGQSVVGFWLNTIKCYEAMLAVAPQPK
ncbi:hypothetical protein AB3M75_20050 [Serratia ureilytica]|uniref:hypothetical protein n=1 Tax=Serratia ureilytica TaxID=300181 RepID=UPI00371EBDFB